MRRHLEKKIAILLALAMIISVIYITPNSVWAKDKIFCYIAMEYDTKPADFPESEYIYRYSQWEDPVEICNSWGGASYDVKTNTLTLNNFNRPTIGLIVDGMGKENFDSDFTIKLIGTNAIKRIDAGTTGINIQGSGSLTINENKEASGAAIAFSNNVSENEKTKFSIGKDATVIIYKSPDNEYADGYGISFAGVDKDADKTEDYLSYGGKVTPDIKWETVKTFSAWYDSLSLTDILFVKTDYSTARLYNDKDNTNAIRILVEGQPGDKDSGYAWIEKHNAKWYVSRSFGYFDGINGAYTGNLPDDLLTGTDTITAYMPAGSKNADNFADAFYVYTKDDKYYAIVPKVMLVDEWEVTNVDSDIYCMGEIIHDTQEFIFNSSNELYDPWIMNSYTEVAGVTTGAEADKYMTDNGYTQLMVEKSPAEYAFCTVNDSIKFYPEQAPATPTPTATTQPTAAPTQEVKPSASPTAGPTTAPAAKKGDKATDTKTGTTYTVTEVKDGKAKAECKGPKSSKTKKYTIPSKYTIDGNAATVTAIAKNAFANNKKVTSVKVPTTLEVIKKGAFKKCTKLNNFTIPKNVTEIQASAFEGCKGMKKMTVKSKNITKVGKDAFKGLPKNAVIKVPKEKKKAYKKLFKKAGFKGKVK